MAYTYDRTASVWLDLACKKMWGPIMEWIHRPSSGKSDVFKAYAALPPRARTALEQDVRRAFHSAHGGSTVTAYRYKDKPRHMGGMSLTTEEPTYLSKDKYTAYAVKDSDVLAHWAQDDLPLGGNAYGHEKELILRPDANPRQINL